MQRKATANETKRRRDRPLRGDGGGTAKSLKSLLPVLIALAAAAAAATFFVDRLTNNGVLAERSAQAAIARHPPWGDGGAAIRAAFEGDPKRDRYMAAMSTLIACANALGPQPGEARLPDNPLSMGAADVNNRVTRLCAAALSVRAEGEKGRNVREQYAAFDQSMRASTGEERCRIYDAEWRAEWSRMLKKYGLAGLTAGKPSVQDALTPQRFITAMTVQGLSKTIHQCLDLAQELNASGRTGEARQTQAIVMRTLRCLIDETADIGTTMLCADLIMKTASASASTSQDAKARVRVWRDGLRAHIHSAIAPDADWGDLTHASVCGSILAYRSLLSSLIRFGVAFNMVLGSALACAISLLHCIWVRLRARPTDSLPTEQPNEGDATRPRMWFSYLLLDSCAFLWLVLFSSVWIHGGRPTPGWWALSAQAAALVFGFAAFFVWRPTRGPASFAFRPLVALLLGAALTLPTLPSSALIRAERWARENAWPLGVACVAVMAAAAIAIIKAIAARQSNPRSRSYRNEIQRLNDCAVTLLILCATMVATGVAYETKRESLERAAYDARYACPSFLLGADRFHAALSELDRLISPLETGRASSTTTASSPSGL